MATFDPDGPGGQPELLIVGGQFKVAGDVLANNIAAWDGASWYPLGKGVTGDHVSTGVSALAVFDDGNGPALYAGGNFTSAGDMSANHIAKWDGSSWSALGPGVGGETYADVRVLAVFDGGTGPALYVGGNFTSAGGSSANYVAKWDGFAWSSLGTGSNSAVSALAGFDHGTGPALYASGSFLAAGGAGVSQIARWDGLAWTPLETGPSELCHGVQALTVFDDGNGPALYAGGSFQVDCLSASTVAKWDGSSWSSVGTGRTPSVETLAVFDDGSGPALYAGGSVNFEGGADAYTLVKWDDGTWRPLDGGLGNEHSVVDALAVFDDGTGPALFAGGTFRSAGGADALGIAAWDGASWSPLGSGIGSSVLALTVFDDGTGPAVYAGGEFTDAGGVNVNHIAKRQGSSWFPLGTGMNGKVLALAVFDDGTGPALYAGGKFTSAGGAPANHVAKWDGSSWAPLGAGLDDRVSTLAVFDDGNGPGLYAGGRFSTAGGLAAEHVARWDGSSWSPLGEGTNRAVVLALTANDDGSGPALYAGGDVTTAGGVAKWNGEFWSPIGAGVLGYVYSLAWFDDGTGPALYAGGWSLFVEGAPDYGIARWNHSSWSLIGVAMDAYAFTIFDDGTGPALYAGGHFLTSGGARNIARWHESSWSPLGTGLDGSVEALAVLDDGSGPTLYAGGRFTMAGDEVSAYFARWKCEEPACPFEDLAAGSPRGAEALETLRLFRDRVLSRTEAGRRYIELYYEHAAEVRQLIRSNRARRWKATGLLFELLPQVRRAADGEPFSPGPAQLSRLDAFVQELQADAGPDLARELKALRRELASGELPDLARDETKPPRVGR